MRLIVRFRLLAAVALGAVLLGCGLFPRERPLVEPALPEPPSTSASIIYPVEKGDIALAIDGSAEVTPVRETALYFRESGRIKEITVVPNQKVSSEEVLARLDIGDLEHQLRLAVIDLKMARLTYDRMVAMGGNVYDRRIQELAVAREEETTDYLQARVDASTIRAPYAGIIKSVQSSVSDRVADYATVIELTDPAALELQMKVSRDAYDVTREGQEAQVRTSQGAWVPTRVIQTTHRNPARDASVRSEEYIIHLVLPRLGEDATMGRVLAAQIIQEQRKGTLLIPLAGLREYQGRTYVRVLEGDARREVDVRVGIRTDTQAEILDGLAEGEKVIGR